MIRLYEAEKFTLIPRTKYELVCKWGFDSTNVKDFKQTSENKDKQFKNLFCTSFVPLRLNEVNTNQVNINSSIVFFIRSIGNFFLLVQKLPQ